MKSDSITRSALLVAAAALSGHATAQTTTYAGASGNFNIDTWSNPANWDNGVPSGSTDVVIAAGEHVSVLALPPTWTGDLTVGAGAIMHMGNGSSLAMHDAVFGNVGTYTLEAGSRTLLRTGANTVDNYDLVVAGDAEWAIGTSTSAHGRLRTLAGDITGSANLGIRTTNRQALTLTGDNSGFTGTLYIGDNDGAGFGDNLSENNRAALIAGSAEALPDLLQVGGGINLVVNVDNEIDTLTIFGPSNDQQGHIKLLLNANLTVANANVKGVALGVGTYDINSGILDDDGITDFFGGVGQLIVTGGTPALPGDTNGDGDIDDSDLGTSFANYTGPVGIAGGKTAQDGDTDGDGDVDDSDLGTSFAGYTGPQSPVAVPEPTSLALLSLGGLAMVRRRRA